MNCGWCGVEFAPAKPTRRFCSRSCATRMQMTLQPPTTNAGSFRPGFVPWNTGIRWTRGPHTEETKRKISAAHLNNGRPRKTPELELLRKGNAYKTWRRAVFERDDYRCQICGERSRAGHRVSLVADHILPFARFPALRFRVSNGRTLCDGCHKQTPTYGNGSRR